MTAKTTTSAVDQATDVILNPRASREQKIDAATKVAEVTATETVKQTVRKLATPSRIEKGKQYVKQGAQYIGARLPQAAAVAAGGIAYGEQKKKLNATWKAEQQLANTKKRLKGQKLTKAQEKTLRKQYREHFTKNPNAAPV